LAARDPPPSQLANHSLAALKQVGAARGCTAAELKKIDIKTIEKDPEAVT
jgi:hypothetical protein